MKNSKTGTIERKKEGFRRCPSSDLITRKTLIKSFSQDSLLKNLGRSSDDELMDVDPRYHKVKKCGSLRERKVPARTPSKSVSIRPVLLSHAASRRKNLAASNNSLDTILRKTSMRKTSVKRLSQFGHPVKHAIEKSAESIKKKCEKCIESLKMQKSATFGPVNIPKTRRSNSTGTIPLGMIGLKNTQTQQKTRLESGSLTYNDNTCTALRNTPINTNRVNVDKRNTIFVTQHLEYFEIIGGEVEKENQEDIRKARNTKVEVLTAPPRSPRKKLQESVTNLHVIDDQTTTSYCTIRRSTLKIGDKNQYECRSMGNTTDRANDCRDLSARRASLIITKQIQCLNKQKIRIRSSSMSDLEENSRGSTCTTGLTFENDCAATPQDNKEILQENTFIH